MTRLTSLLLAAACFAAVAGLPGTGEARGPRHDDRCGWVQNRHWAPGFRPGHFAFGPNLRGLFPGPRPHILAPRQVRKALRRQGFHRIRSIDYRRGVYRAVARGRHGWPQELYVHPVSGRVVCAKPLRRHFAARRFTPWHGWTGRPQRRSRFHW